jgi:acyl dehydratase
MLRAAHRRLASSAVTVTKAITDAMMELDGIGGLQGQIGSELGVSNWHRVEQVAIDKFAAVTGDDQWIHVDPARAAQSQFRSTIAHGFYTLALVPVLSREVYEVHGFSFAINYGLNKVRFPAPMPVDDRVRMSVLLSAVDSVAGGVQVETVCTFHREGGERPVCVADTLARYLV